MMCVCAMHCPDSPYHERACCGATECDCWCHERPPERQKRKYLVWFQIARNPNRFPLLVEAEDEAEALAIAAAEISDPDGRPMEILKAEEQV